MLCNVWNGVSWLRISKNKDKAWYWTFLIKYWKGIETVRKIIFENAWEPWDRFLHLACQRGNSPLYPLSVTPLTMIYCIYIIWAVRTQLQQDKSWWRSLVYGRTCLINLCFGWVDARLERRECFHINRYITVVNLFSISQWLLALERWLLTPL